MIPELCPLIIMGFLLYWHWSNMSEGDLAVEVPANEENPSSQSGTSANSQNSSVSSFNAGQLPSTSSVTETYEDFAIPGPSSALTPIIEPTAVLLSDPLVPATVAVVKREVPGNNSMILTDLSTPGTSFDSTTIEPSILEPTAEMEIEGTSREVAGPSSMENENGFVLESNPTMDSILNDLAISGTSCASQGIIEPLILEPVAEMEIGSPGQEVSTNSSMETEAVLDPEPSPSVHPTPSNQEAENLAVIFENQDFPLANESAPNLMVSGQESISENLNLAGPSSAPSTSLNSSSQVNITAANIEILTRNPFFNYVQRTRSLHLGYPQKEIVKIASQEWNKMTPEAKMQFKKSIVGRSTSNPWLNFVREIRGARPGQHQSEILREASRQWRSLTKEEKEAHEEWAKKIHKRTASRGSLKLWYRGRRRSRPRPRRI
jgi:hypothetical protein